MKSTGFFQFLDKNISITDQKSLFESIRLDSIIWDSFSNLDVVKKITEELGFSVENWSLGKICLIESGLSLDILSKSIREKLYLKKAITLFENIRNNASVVNNLEDATLLALALYERSAKNKNWKGLLNDLGVQKFDSRSQFVSSWRTPLAILYSLLDNHDDLLIGIASDPDDNLSISIINHIIAVQLISKIEKVNTIKRLVEMSGSTKQISWYQSFPTQLGFLVPEISEGLHKPYQIRLENEKNIFKSFKNIEDQIQENVLSGYKSLLENSNNQAHAHFVLAKDVTKKLHDFIDLLCLESDAERDSSKIEPKDPFFEDILISNYGNSIELNQFGSGVVEPKGILLKLSSLIDLKNKGEQHRAKELSIREFEHWLTQRKNNWPAIDEIELIQRIDHQKIIDQLKELDLGNLIEKYVRFLEEISKSNPNINPIILDSVTEFLSAEDQYAKYKINLVVEPKNKSVHKNLFKLLNLKKDWETLFDEYENSEKRGELEAGDWVKYALAACNAGKLDTAIRLCEKLRSSGADSSHILTIQGQISYLQEDFEAAKSYLLDAIKTNTDSPDAWLKLAEIYSKEENFEETIATLRSAVLAVPDYDEIHFALASSCLRNNHFTEALPYLKKAIALNPENEQYYVAQIIVLKELGHNDDANNVLSKARIKWPMHDQIAFLDAKRSLENGDREQALVAFKDAIGNSTNPPTDWMLLYSKTLLNDDENQFTLTDKNALPLENLAIAQKVLQKIVKSEGKSTTYASLLLGEVLFILNEIEAAHSIYIDLVNALKDNGELSEWNWRVSAGMGMVKIALNENEIGLVMLKDAVTRNSAHIGIKHALAEAFLDMNLNEEGIRVAKDAYSAGSTDVRNLVWYSDFMKKVNESQEVIKALENANLLSNFDESISLRLAKEYVTVGNIQGASSTLETILAHDLNDYGFLREVSLTYLRISDYEKSYAAYKKALLNLHQISLENQIEFLYLCFKNNKWQETLDQVQRLISQNYSFVSTYTIQAECLEGLNQHIQALNAYEQAIQSKRKLSEYLKLKNSIDLFVPLDWILSLEKEESILTKIASTSLKANDFEKSIKSINRVIELQPDEATYKLFGADIALQLNDLESARSYLGDVDLTNGLNNDEVLSSIYNGLKLYIDLYGNNKISNTEPVLGTKNLITILIDITNKIRVFDLNEAKNTLLQLNPRISSDSQFFTQTNLISWLSQAWKNTFFRLAISNAIEIYEFPVAMDLLNQWAKNEGSSVELSLLKMLTLTAYEMIYPLLLATNVNQHRSKDLEKMMKEKNWKNDFYLLSSSQGKSTILKSFEKIASVCNNSDVNNLALILSNSEFPRLFKFVVIDRLLQLNQISLVENYFNSHAPRLIDLHMFTKAFIRSDPQRLLNFFNQKTVAQDPITFASLSLIYNDQKIYDQALENSELAINLWSNEELWKVENALLYDKLGDSKTSFLKWEQLINDADNIQNVIFPYLELLIRNGKSAEVIRLLNQHKEDLNGDFEFHFYTSLAYLVDEKYDLALQSIQFAKKKDPENLNALIVEGKINFSMNHFDAAKQIANVVIQKDRNFVDGYLLLVSIYESQRKIADAGKILDEALTFNPNNHELLLNKVWNLRELGLLPDALKIVSQMSVDNPNDWEAFSLLALLYNDLEDYRASEENAKKSLRLNPDQPEIMMLLGRILKKQGQLDQAIEYFSKSAIVMPNMNEPCIEIGDIYYEQQNFPDALDAYQEAINRKENDARPFFKAGLIMKEVKDYQGAEKMLKIAANLAPKDTNIRRQLAGVIALNFVHSPLEAK